MVGAMVIFFLGYRFYGRWLEKTWGIDPAALTPAQRFNDGNDFSPQNRWSVFAHQFTSITGAGPVTGPIIAAMFGWLPALLWMIVGGIFFGAVQDFTALYASVKNNGRSIGMLIEDYIGALGRRLFLLFCWLFTLLVIAAFCGHNHTNTYIGTLDGVDLGFTPGCGFNEYGDGLERGVRVIELNERDLSTYETYLLTFAGLLGDNPITRLRYRLFTVGELDSDNIWNMVKTVVSEVLNAILYLFQTSDGNPVTIVKELCQFFGADVGYVERLLR